LKFKLAPRCIALCVHCTVHCTVSVQCVCTTLCTVGGQLTYLCEHFSFFLFFVVAFYFSFFRMLGTLPTDSLSFSYDNDICRRLVEGDESKSIAGDLNITHNNLNRTQLISTDDNKSENDDNFTQQQLQVFNDYPFLIDMDDSKLIDESLSLP
jgi:hypothetical protein